MAAAEATPTFNEVLDIALNSLSQKFVLKQEQELTDVYDRHS